MRVLLNGLQAANRSGTGRYVQALCQMLPAAAPDIETTLVWPAEAPCPALADSVTVVGHGASPLSRVAFDHAGVRGAAARAGADLLHYPASTGCLFPSRPVVQTVHDLCFLAHPEWFPPSRNAYYRTLIGRTARRADMVLADSRATADDAHRLLGIQEQRIRVTPLGVGPEFRRRSRGEQDAARAKYGIPEPFFLFVGTLEPRKNLPRLVRAWDRVWSPGHPHLVLAGRRGWRLGEFDDAVRAARHGSAMRFPGFVEESDLPALMSAARALVWPSLMEGFGLPPLEAMACGTPVLSSNASSIPEVTGSAALLVDPENEGQIAEALAALAHDDRLCAGLAESGGARALRFTWRRTAELTAAAYRALA